MKTAGKSGLRLFTLVAFTAVMCPAPAGAHLNSTGIGPAYDGLMHFVTSPEDLVPVLALALLAGLRGKAYGRRALFVLPATWLVGGFAGLAAAAANPSAVLIAITFVLLGGLVAMDAKPSLRATTALAGLVGIFHGYLNGTGMGETGSASAALLGLVFGVFILVALTATLVVKLQAAWARIAVRVVGNWIVASGLLMLEWTLRGKA